MKMHNKKTIEIKQWVTSNGNHCFSFTERTPFERSWIIIIAFLVLAITSCIEYFINGTCFLILPFIILFLFLFLWWLTTPLKANERVIGDTVHHIMDTTATHEAAAVNASVIKSFVHYDTKGTYGIITAICFLVLLDNGEVWEYPITRHKEKEEGASYFECGKDHIVSSNEQHIKAIKPKFSGHLLSWAKLPDQVRLGILIFAIFIVGGLAFVGVYWLIFRFKWWTLVVVGAYFTLYSITEWIYSKSQVSFIRVIRRIVSIPFFLLYAFVGIIHPFITIAGTYFFVSVFAFGFPAAVLMLFTKSFGWELRPETIAFIVVSAGSILCANSYAATKWMIHQSPLRNWGNHNYEFNRESLAVYLIHPDNMVFLLYLLYFLFLAVSGYLQIQKEVYLLSETLDAAILKAFLVFIAFTNMRSKAKKVKMDASGILRGILGLFVHDNHD